MQTYATSENIKKSLLTYLTFRKPLLINSECILNLDKEKEGAQLEEIYVVPLFMKPGRQMYACSLPNGADEPSYYVSSLVVKKREEEVPVITKDIKQKKVERTFQKQNSVFKDWREDTE